VVWLVLAESVTRLVRSRILALDEDDGSRSEVAVSE